jgi:polyhydroxybutyrate depolymerase
VPIIAFHGAVDPQVPYAGGVIDDGREPDLPDVMAVESWASRWAERNECDPVARPEAMIGQVEPLVWDACAAPVRLYRIEDGGHTWPGSVLAEPMTNRDISATELIWQFLRTFHMAS